MMTAYTWYHCIISWMNPEDCGEHVSIIIIMAIITILLKEKYLKLRINGDGHRRLSSI